MRVLVLALIALAASAQDADPRPAWTYDPVAVGNVRSYAQGLTPESTVYWRTDSPTAVTRDGLRWTVRRTQRFFRLDGGGGWGRTETRTLIRFDTTAANVITRSESGTTAPLYPCRLDVPLAPTGGTCNGDVPYTKTSDGRLTFRDRGNGFATVLQAGIGVVGGSTDRSPDFELVGAVIDGVLLMEEPEAFPDSQIDPTPAWRYAPMSAGDEWQYERWGGAAGPDREYRWVHLDAGPVIDGESYLGVSESVYTPGSGGWTGLAETNYVRFDTLSARIVGPDPRGTIGPIRSTECPLDEPSQRLDETQGPEDWVYCEVFDTGSRVWGEYVATAGTFSGEVGGGSLSASSRSFLYLGIADYNCPSMPVYVAGVGYAGFKCDSILDPYNRLIYARVRQPDGTLLELGQRYAVSADLGPQAGTLSLTVGPNPTAGPVTLRLDVPVGGAVRWTIADALGRVIWERDEIRVSGVATASLDLSDAPAGLYVARAATARGAVTATIVRR